MRQTRGRKTLTLHQEKLPRRAEMHQAFLTLGRAIICHHSLPSSFLSAI
jgi:hypothetical protein